ncbi:voltage-dependent calcium channel subunit alpha-2/delta-3-like [Homarus americanus]|uniref:voltage-dependent calcium channel subunit alpha-2/delta-3-like n=1 Tax=Homarus americanus TaxID=6706 RepID=UPI001C47292D|nr:voltage-dependent calcium channel subunit alpha-2/delta-3-like [Homarus americanus]
MTTGAHDDYWGPITTRAHQDWAPIPISQIDCGLNFAENHAKILENDGLQLVKEMAGDVTNMMKFKVEAVKRIMNVAEEASLDKEYQQEEEVEYYNAKRLNKFYPADSARKGELLDGYKKLTLLENTHFDGIPVNENFSSVHVPTNVYDKAPDVINAIRWSGRLDRTFKSNYELDPTLSWQYFGSSTGFLRQYPASEWVMDEKDPDLYDARLRSWYIEAANSPKDMVILLDVSGEIDDGLRGIAKHVVLNILETLNENDFVNVFNFSLKTVELVPVLRHIGQSSSYQGCSVCIRVVFVYANLENLGEFKKALNFGETKDIANFTQALTQAFELLQRSNSKYNKSGQGSQCNQAIMVVTDGAPYNYEEIFEKYNWPHLQVRMFTYLIGREENKVRYLNWMACANKGYFVHVTTLAEVREQVLKYIPVMARPMVMYQSNHPHRWTGVYADIADPKQTEWLWEVRERKRQMDRTKLWRKLKTLVNNKDTGHFHPRHLDDPVELEKYLKYGKFGLSNLDIARIKAERARSIRTDYRRIYHKGKWTLMIGRRGAPGLREGYRLMTSVSVPVFDRKKTSNITERILLNESVWVMRKREVRTANLLGVAGTDVPIREIEKLVPPYKLGVNGYSFMVNRNGYVLYHPDLRPVHEEANAEVLRKSRDKRKWFQDILKPNYNSVDFAEVELTDNEAGPRANNSDLLALTMWRDYNSKLRRELIEQRDVEAMHAVKIHLDGMKRVVQREQWYYTQMIGGTPFSLGIALPESYGKYKVHGQIELTREIQDPRTNKEIMDHFASGNWTLHPDWVYCEYKYDQNRVFQSPEDLMKDFLSRAQKPHWKWRSTRTRPPPEPTMNQAQYNTWKPVVEDDRSENYYCDKDLVQSLLFDARATNVYENKGDVEDLIEGKNPVAIYITLLYSQVQYNFGMTTAFVATRSGLTRWLDLTQANPGEENAHNIHSDEPHFMKIHNRAIDEVWYKRAVDYYEEDSKAYVYSVPFDAATRDPEDVLVTATRAIFIEENTYRRAPAAVVGVTIKHSKFVEYFKNETYKCPSYPSRDSSCKTAKTCESTSLDCYLLDDNGFIIASEREEDTGKFFGTLEGTIIESLVSSGVYKRIRIFDYQAVCLDSQVRSSMASILHTPIQMMRWAANWIMGNIFWLMVKTQLYTLLDPNAAWSYTHSERETQYPNFNEPPSPPPEHPEYKEANSDHQRNETEDGVEEEDILAEYSDVLDAIYYDVDGVHPDDQMPPDYEGPYIEEDGDFPSISTTEIPELTTTTEIPIEMARINKTHPRPCDKEVYLYKLQNENLLQNGEYKPLKAKLSNCHTNGCGRPFSVQKVISTNLILVAVNNLCPCESRKVDIEPVEVDYNETMHCNRLLLQHFRKRPEKCINYHPEEHEITLCGGAGALSVPSLALATLLLLAHTFNTQRLRS